MTLPKINNLLLILIIVVNGYVICAPLVPAVLFGWQSHQGKQQQLTSALHAKYRIKPSTLRGNYVIIPSMLLDQPILEGPIKQTYSILDKGIWRWPEGSTPSKGGNTVLIGHRFTYTNPRGVFYYLNKLTLGGEIGIFWNNQEYLYKVSDIEQVPPSDTAIEANTPNSQLTLFTCTPLWLPKDLSLIHI